MQHITSEEAKKQAGSTWLIYGPAGVGKTPLASCFPSPWIWDFEAGTASTLTPCQITRFDQNPGAWGDIMGCIQALQQAKEGVVSIGNPKLEFPCRTLVIDTIGEYCRTIIGVAKGSKEVATLPEWGLMVERTRVTTRSVRNLRDKGMNVVFIAHEQYLKQDESNLILGLPDLPGKELPTDLPKLCDFVAHMTVKRKVVQGGSELQRVLSFAPGDQFIARDRLGRMAESEVLPPFTDVKAIQKLLREKAGLNYD